MLLYPQFFRQHGVRRPVQLVAPPLSKLDSIDLPRDSILHFVSEDESLYGMPQDDYLLRHITRMIYVDHLRELGDNKGPPRPTRLPPGPMIRDYHRKFRRTRQLMNLENALRDGRTLIIENYALLPHLYRYTASFFRNYYKWWNIQAALWEKVGELSAKSNRQQYIECRLPTVLPSINQLRKGEVYTNRSVIKAFTEHESLFILELWKWLGQHRSNSVLSKVKPEALANMNLLWMEGSKWVVVNLGLLDQWRRPSEEEKKAGAEDKGVVDPVTLQKRFLRMLMHLFECRIKDDDGQAPMEKAEVVLDKPDVDLTEPTATDSVPAPQAKLVEAPIKIQVPDQVNPEKTIKVTLKPNVNFDHLPIDFVEETEENNQLIDAAITKDLEALNHLQDELEEADEDSNEPPEPKELAEVQIAYEPEERSLESGVMNKVDALADAGMLSGAEYRRFTALSTAYKKLPDPYGKEPSLEHQARIDPKILAMPTKPQIKDTGAIVDKSMLKSTLFDFDVKYVNEVLPKDVTGMVLSVQHGGVAVAGYQVERIQDALNVYDAHTVNLVPVQGKPSTIHFRLPAVSEDGTFMVGGVRYRLRKQRGDLPIRKLSPDKVALTSYYAKVFVVRSDKQVHNYPGWLTNQIAARGMDPSNETITHLMVSNVFDSSIKVPRIYSIMASRFRSFEIQTPGWSALFFFDYHARETQFGKEVVAAAEKGGLTIVGKRTQLRDKSIHPVVMDEGGTLYDLSGDKMEVVGTFESLLGLDSRKAPMEVALVKVLNKLIPVGIFLAYHLGFETLLELLKINPRRVSTGERLNLSDDEYAVVFEDETLIFPKDNRIVALIMTGFNVYSNTIENYPLHQFNRRDIYLNVLEPNGIGIRYLREMDLMVDMFVDPITEEILKTMKEPTDLIGLLLRSCELLQTDWAPAETDMAYMRIKGYERFAGVVYGELVKAIRLQRARGNNNAPIDMTPYAVSQMVLQDPAVKLVEDSNPVHNLKEKEEVTYSGVGGRSARSMVSSTRVFHPNDMGVISEATKDSADVAITTFLTADPNFKDLRGVTNRHDESELGPTSLLSTSALLAPAADRDDQLVRSYSDVQVNSL